MSRRGRSSTRSCFDEAEIDEAKVNAGLSCAQWPERSRFIVRDESRERPLGRDVLRGRAEHTVCVSQAALNGFAVDSRERSLPGTLLARRREPCKANATISLFSYSYDDEAPAPAMLAMARSRSFLLGPARAGPTSLHFSHLPAHFRSPLLASATDPPARRPTSASHLVRFLSEGESLRRGGKAPDP